MMVWEILVEDSEKLPSNVRFDITAEWWVEPHNVSFSCAFGFLTACDELQVLRIAVFCECFVVCWSCFLKLFLIAGIV